MVAAGGVRTGRPEHTAAIIISWLLAEQRPLSGVAPPLERRQRSPRANAVSGWVDREKHFVPQLLEHRREARPLLGIVRAALRGELQQRPGAARERDAVV